VNKPHKLAHRLMAEPSESEIRDLVSTLAGGARAAFNAARYLPSVTAQADKFADLRYWFFSYAMHLDMLCVRTKYEKDNFVKIMQVEAVLYANKMVGGPELNEKDVRQRFSLEDPPSGGEIFKPKSKSGD